MITLEYFNESDFEQLIRWIQSEEFLIQWAGPQFEYPLTEYQLAEYIDGSNDLKSSQTLIYKAIDGKAEEVVGHICLGSIDRNHRSGRIGKVLVGPTNRRSNGIGQSMIESVLKIGFEELGLHRISLGVFDFNHAAIRCYEKIGFVKEGLLRDARRFRGSYWNLFEMSMLEEEWKIKSDRM